MNTAASDMRELHREMLREETGVAWFMIEKPELK
jgi:hypothetical protein|tara:strand:+ start:82 stop:183 length:102 start_codon:yes stop_codon:yes gene_type:complete